MKTESVKPKDTRVAIGCAGELLTKATLPILPPHALANFEPAVARAHHSEWVAPWVDWYRVNLD